MNLHDIFIKGERKFISLLLLISISLLIGFLNKGSENPEIQHIYNTNDNLYKQQKAKLELKLSRLYTQLDSVKSKKDSIRIKYIPYYIAISKNEDKRDEILYEYGILDDSIVHIEDHDRLIDFRLVQGVEAIANLKLCKIENRINESIIEEYKDNSQTDSVYIQSILQDLKVCVIAKDQCSSDLSVSKEFYKVEKKKSNRKNWVIIGLSLIIAKKYLKI